MKAGWKDGLMDARMDSAITICLPKFLWGHKNSNNKPILIKQRQQQITQHVWDKIRENSKEIRTPATLSFSIESYK